MQVGDVRLALVVPGGFTDSLPTGSPRLLELAESFTAASNRILVFALTDADMRRFNTGDAPELKQYLLVVTTRSLEQERLSPQAFDRYVRDGLRSVGPAIEGDFAKAMEARPAGEPVLMAELLREPDAASVLRAVRVPQPQQGLFSFSKPSQYILSSTSVVLLRGKALTLTVTSGYESKADQDWVRDTTLRWIEELRRLNVSR